MSTGQIIVKVQRPIVSNDPDMIGHVLVYNEDRSVRAEIDIAQVPEFAEDEYKYFAWAVLEPSGHLVIGPRAPWQEW